MKKLFTVSALTVALLSGCAVEQNTMQTAQQAEMQAGAVIKSPNDDRAYKTLQLANGIEVMLVSDASVEKSAAALSVGVGLLHDPMTQQGMAHYLEHMLFLGTEKYPDPQGYAEFMTANGGQRNAYTWLDITNYMFKINNDAYPEALDRFSDFFKSPKLYPEYTDKEKNAVNAEWSMRREMDFFGQFKLGRSLLGDHPANRFLIGNLESLGDKEHSKLHPETVEFFEQYYSANIMKVAMISNKPIAEMEMLAQQYFGDIENKNIEEPEVTDQLDFSKIGAKRIHYVPNQDVKELRLDFIIDDNSDQYALKPNKFITYILGSEMPGSPAYELKARGLIAGLTASASPTMYGNYGSLSVSIELTDAGMQKREDIVAVVMNYIDLIKQQGVDEKYFSEIKTSLNNSFRFLEKGDEFQYVSQLAAAMQNVPVEQAISSPFYYEKFDAKAINDVLAQLSPERLRVWYVSQQEPHDSELHFYDGKYKVVDLDPAELNKPVDIALHLPAVNRLLPENFDLKQVVATDKPVLVIDEPNAQVWQYPSQLFADQPRGVFNIYFNSSAPRLDVKANVLADLWADIYNLQQSALATEAQIAGMRLSMGDQFGVRLTVSGFTDKQPELLEQALAALPVEVSEQAFAQAVDRYIRGIQNQGKEFPFYQAFDAYNSIVREGFFNAEARIAAAKALTVTDLTQYISEQLSKHQMRIFAFGNYDKADLTRAVATIEQALPANRVLTAYQRPAYWAPSADQKIVWQQDLTVADVGIVDVHVNPDPSFATRAKASVLRSHFATSVFEKLRTEEQLAYAVGGTARNIGDYTGFAMYIQTPVKDVEAMQARFDAFKLEYKDMLANLSEEEFQRLKASTLVELNEPPKNLSEEVRPLLTDWYKEEFNFDSKQKLIAEVEKVTLAQLQAFYADTMLNPNAARVSVQMRGTKFAEQPFADLPGATVVTDLAKFHNSMTKQQ